MKIRRSIAALGAASASALAMEYAYRRVFYVDKARIADPFKLLDGEIYGEKEDYMRNLIKESLSIPYTNAYKMSFDGYKLRARYYEVKKGAPLQIMFHGYRGHAIRDFSGGLQLALESGCNVLLVDERAHGESEGKCLSFGVLERRDVLSWVKYAIARFGKDVEILLVGISMGAATVIMASDLELPSNVKGIIADCPYSSPKEIIMKVSEDEKLSGKLTYPLVKSAAKVIGGFDLDESSAVKSAKNAKLPLLLIHGEADSFVPHCMSVEIFNNYAGPKSFESFPGADHGVSFVVDYERYKDAVYKFVNEHVNVKAE